MSENKKSMVRFYRIMALLIVICSLLIACDNPWVINGTDPLYEGRERGKEALLYKAGDIGPGGGIIFYVDPKGFNVPGVTLSSTSAVVHLNFPDYTAHYLEVKVLENNSWADYSALSSANVDDTETSLGTGRRNTALIRNALGDYCPAARACSNLEYNGGYEDWFLPSLAELQELYKNKSLVDDLESETGSFWSSSQFNTANAWYVSFSDGTEENAVKSDSKGVIAVRAF